MLLQVMYNKAIAYFLQSFDLKQLLKCYREIHLFLPTWPLFAIFFLINKNVPIDN